MPYSFYSQTARLIASVLPAALLTTGCAVVERAGIAALYEKSILPDNQALRDIPYGPDVRHRLDLFLPAGQTGWPTAVFVHGGSWNSGDKNLKVGGADVYGNSGRYLAAQGIGAAVMNYRLQPHATWRDQVDDVARATAWVQRNIAAQGGRGDRIFLYGHSAGAQLAAFTALEKEALVRAGGQPGRLRGVIAVSGAGLDLMDAGTYALGHSPDYYRSVIDPDKTNGSWRRDGSAVSYIGRDAPPFLVMVGGSEEKAMIRQSRRLHEALTSGRVPSDFLEIHGQSHGRIVLTLSRPDKVTGPAVVDFIRRHSR